MLERAWNAVLNWFGVHDARREPTCCPRPSWVAERDLDGARGFDFDLGRCERCGTPWMHAWCRASSMGGYEPITREEAERLRTLPEGPELSALVKAWGEKLG